MEEFKGTKAPWAWQKFGDATFLTAQHGMREIIIGSITDTPAMNVDGILRRVDADFPNAKLIAAAPDLLEALQEMNNWCRNMKDWSTTNKVDLDPPFEKAEQAINKALGK